jgi:hypothetical protein
MRRSRRRMSEKTLMDLTAAIACGVAGGILFASAAIVVTQHFSLWAARRIEDWLAARREKRRQEERVRDLLDDVNKIMRTARERETR